MARSLVGVVRGFESHQAGERIVIDMSENTAIGIAGIVASVMLLGIIAGLMAGCPRYKVWSKEMDGRASLAEAESSRRITVLEATAKKDSAKMLAEAEVERAKGVAEANRIIGDSLKGHDDYLRYLWITGLESGTGRETVYVPTEAGLPILEATRRADRPEVP